MTGGSHALKYLSMGGKGIIPSDLEYLAARLIPGDQQSVANFAADGGPFLANHP